MTLKCTSSSKYNPRTSLAFHAQKHKQMVFSHFTNRCSCNIYIEARGMDGGRGPVRTACCIESPQTHCSSQNEFCAQQRLTDTKLMKKLMRGRTTRLCTYSLGMHWTNLPSCNCITPSVEAAACSSVMTLVRDMGMPTGAFFGS